MEKLLRPLLVFSSLILYVHAQVGTTSCTSNDNCVTLANTQCSGSTCECKVGYKANGDASACIPNTVGDACTDANDCQFIANSHCPSGTCACTDGHTANAGDSTCIVVALGAGCTTSTDCSTIANAECSGTSGAETCSCKTGFSASGGSCSANRIGSACNTNTDCSTVVTNSQCDNNVCECLAGHTAVNENTQCDDNVIGSPCTTDTDCSSSIANSECSDSNQCACSAGHVADAEGTSCTQIHLEGTCTLGSSDCDSIANAECRDDGSGPQCLCVTGYEGTSGTTTCSIKNCGVPGAIDGYSFGAATHTTYLSTVSVTCASGWETNPDEGSIICQADGTWSTPTGCARVDCGTPSAFIGYVVGSVGSCGTVYECTVSTTCADGYEGTGTDILCQADTAWSTPTGCSKKDCGNPSFEGYTLGTPAPDTLYEATVSVTACATGFETSPSTASLTCTAAGTWDQPAGCSRIDCGTPSAYTGYVVGSVGSCGTVYECTVSTTCADGYEGTGTDILCQADTAWSTPTGCSKKDCGNPSFEGYTLGTPSPDTLFEATVSVTACATGFETSPSTATLTCSAAGTWEEPAGCSRIDCGTPSTYTGYVVGSVGSCGTVYECTVSTTCADGYEGTGTDILCQADTAWSTPTGCSKKDCGNPSFEGYTLGTPAPDTLYEATVSVTECATGFETSPSTASLTCTAAGTWEQPAGCSRVDCGNPSFEGYTLGTPSPDTLYEATVDVSECAPGYETTPSTATLTCTEAGTWDQPAGCAKIDCGNPSFEGYTLGTPSPDTLYGATVVVSDCASGYETSPSTASLTCTAAGTWDQPAGCTKKDCGNPSFEGYTFGTPAPDTLYGAIVGVSDCATGYETSPSTASLTCTAAGSWDQPAGCARVDCGNPSFEGYTLGTPAPDTLYGASVDVSECATGYETSPSTASLTCTAAGTWDQPAGCTKIDCGNPVFEGYTIGTPSPDTLYGATVAVSDCATGYETTPSTASLTCTAAGTWDQPAGCAKMDCGNPSFEGYTLGTPSPDTLYGATVGVSDCATGYETSPSTATLTCTAAGSWDQPAGCTKLDCGNPVFEGYTLGTPAPDTLYGATVDVSECATGYETSPSTASLTCTAAGTWDQPAGCARIDCGNPVFEGYTLGTPAPDTLYGATVSVSDCATGYETSPSTASLTCTAAGTWDQPAGCTKRDCGNPVFEGYTLGTPAPDTLYGATVDVSNCATGYETTPSTASLTCTAAGTWDQPAGCAKLDCGNPSFEGYTLGTPAPDTLYGATVDVSECATGYETSPSTASLTCTAAGTWDQPAGCARIDCGNPVFEGYTLGTPSPDSRYGSTVDVSDCATGYETTPSTASLTCTAAGTWDQPAGCAKTDCGNPSFEGYTLGTPAPDTLYGATVDVSDCATGYETAPSTASLTCTAAGTWDQPAGCAKTDCGNPAFEGYTLGTPSPDTLYGATVDVSDCATGFETSPSTASLTCTAAGTWDQPAGCTIINCGNPSFEGYTLGTPAPNTLYGATVDVSDCATGYETSPSTASLACTAAGTWDQPAGCAKTDCGNPVFEGYALGTPAPDTLYGATVDVSDCAAGYETSPSIASLTCTAAGTWEQPAGCAKVDCGNPSFEGYTLGTPAPDTLYGSSVGVSGCATGYETSPSIATLTCTAAGTWFQPAGCVKIDCGNPSFEGYTLGTPSPDTLYGATVGVSDCATGYETSPSTATLTCTAAGTWDQPAGCARIDCGNPSFEGYTLGTPTPDTLYESTVDVSDCATGYETTPSTASLTCTAAGSWDQPAGCSRVDCGNPSFEGYTLGTPAPDTLFGATVDVSDCAAGYETTPSTASLTCTAAGAWDQPAGCARVDCGNPSFEGYTLGTPSPDTLYGATVDVSDCATGYETSPSTTSLTCTAAGSWDQPAGCAKTDCGNPVFEGYTLGTPAPDTLYGATVDVSDCATGYETSPSTASLTCTAAGTWDQPAGCTKRDCGSPSFEGYTLGTPAPDTLYGATVGVPDCAAGYETFPSTASLTCTAAGTWDQPAGCGRIDCGNPSFEGYNLGTPSPDTLYESTVDVTDCAAGYETNPSTASLTCTAAGTWDQPAGCARIDCGIPSFEGYTLGTPTPDTLYESTVDVSGCATGYETTPSTASLTCTVAGTWDQPAGCARVDCGTPSISETGYALGSVTTTTYESTAAITCDTGYEGTPQPIICQADTAWSTPTGCALVDCQELSTTGYEYSLSSGTTTYGSTASVTCATGYEGSPNPTTVECLDTGSWTAVSGCTIKDCQGPSDTGYVYTLSDGSTTYGSTASVACAQGYEGSPNPATVDCLATGSWTAVSGCTILDCQQPSTQGYGFSLSSGTTTYGSTATVTCATGYEGSPNPSTVECLDTGSWTDLLGCTIIDCQTPANSGYEYTLSSTDTTYGSTATVACETGYEGTPNPSTVDCLDTGGWTAVSGCTIIDCQQPSDTGYAYTLSSGTTTYGSDASVTCATGYEGQPNPATVNCLVTGIWTAVSGCTVVDCGSPSFAGYSIGSPTPNTLYEATVAVTGCATGYEETSTISSSLTCTETGDWDEPSGCSKVDCGTPPTVAGYTVGAVGGCGTVYECTVSTSCDNGYTGNGSSMACQADRAWSTPTGCDKKDCGNPSFDGFSLGSPTPDTLFEATVAVSGCATGYEETSTISSSLTCTATGVWDEPSGCSKKDCGNPSFDGYNIGTPTPDTLYDATVEVTACAAGYETTPSTASLTCTAGGTWEQPAGCSKKDCGVPSFEGYNLGTPNPDTMFEATIEVTACATGFETTPSTPSLACTTAGTWEEPAGCTKKNCGTPAFDGYTLGTPSPDTLYGATVAVTACAAGYETSPTTSSLTCSAGGTWDNPAGCTIKDCGNPSVDTAIYELGTVAETTFGSTVSLACATGYTGSPDPLSCESSGQWSVPIGCSIVDCGAPSQPGYTITTPSGTDYQSEGVVQQACSEGYTGQATTATVTCGAAGSWSNAQGCSPVDCGDHSVTEGYNFGTVTATTFGATIAFNCAVGYTGSDGAISCTSSATWSNPTGCAKVDCGDPTIISTGYTLAAYTATVYQSTIDVVACATGYTGTVTTTLITCLSTGSWSLPQGCAIVDCEQPEQPTHGSVNIPGGTKYGAQATQSCDLGYSITGSQTIECLHTGQWSSGPVTCSRIYCPESIPPLNGGVSLTLNNEFGSTATFSCDTGFELVGSQTKQCLSSGEWSNADPICQIKGNCGLPPVISYTSVSLNDAGTIATYACVDGYTLVPADIQQLTCASNNVWTGARPQCRIPSTNRGLSITLVSTQITLASLDDPVILAYRKKQVQNEVQILLRRLTGILDLIFTLTGLRTGSLIIEGDIILPGEKATTENYLNASSTMIYNEEPIVIDDQEGTFQSISVVNETFTKTNMAGYICKAYEQLEGPCESGYECVATSTSQTGSAECRLTAKTDNLAVILGVGIGVPLFLLSLVIIIIAAIYVRRQRLRDEKYGSETDSDDKSQFAHQIATRYPGRYPYSHGVEGPGHYEADSSAYSDSRHFNYPWDYDNRFAAPMYIARPKY